ncbi:MAG: hypothetical protein GWO26_28575 [Phycisphaerae bacterium]|nr:hypothetical protein [Phycisphaerae bacterium]
MKIHSCFTNWPKKRSLLYWGGTYSTFLNQSGGYEPRTFEIATNDKGALVFHLVRTALSKDEFQNNRVNNCKIVGKAHGLRSTNNDVVVYFYES